jgi:hypothetical protein
MNSTVNSFMGGCEGLGKQQAHQNIEAAPVPDPAMLVLDPVALVLNPQMLVLPREDFNLFASESTI